MEDKIINTETTETVATKDTEIKGTPSTSTYAQDDYMEEYYLYDDMFYYDEKCFSCKHWLGYDCGCPNGPCNYESY